MPVIEAIRPAEPTDLTDFAAFEREFSDEPYFDPGLELARQLGDAAGNTVFPVQSIDAADTQLEERRRHSRLLAVAASAAALLSFFGPKPKKADADTAWRCTNLLVINGTLPDSQCGGVCGYVDPAKNDFPCVEAKADTTTTTTTRPKRVIVPPSPAPAVPPAGNTHNTPVATPAPQPKFDFNAFLASHNCGQDGVGEPDWLSIINGDGDPKNDIKAGSYLATIVLKCHDADMISTANDSLVISKTPDQLAAIQALIDKKAQAAADAAAAAQKTIDDSNAKATQDSVDAYNKDQAAKKTSDDSIAAASSLAAYNSEQAANQAAANSIETAKPATTTAQATPTATPTNAPPTATPTNAATTGTPTTAAPLNDAANNAPPSGGDTNGNKLPLILTLSGAAVAFFLILVGRRRSHPHPA